MAICLLNINACWPMPVFHLELIDFKTRRVAAFRKNLVELAELELKHAKVSINFILRLFNDFRSMDYLLMICPDLSPGESTIAAELFGGPERGHLGP